MGKRHRRLAALRHFELAQSSVREAETRRESALDADRYLLGYLGTASQVEGTGLFETVDPGVLDYTGRYGTNQSLQDLYARSQRASYPQWNEFIDATRDEANALMEQAEDAARSGDFAEASRLKAAAQAKIDSPVEGLPGGWANVAGEVFPFEEDALDRARIEAGSPIARNVGRFLQSGEDYLARGPEFEETRRNLSEAGIAAIEGGRVSSVRQITEGVRADERFARDIGARRGAGVNPYAERMISARVREAAATDAAEANLTAAIATAGLLQEVEGFLEQWRFDVAERGINIALDYVNQRPGASGGPVQAALDTLDLAEAKIDVELGNLWWQLYLDAEAKEDARSARYQSLAVAGAFMLVGGIAGGIAGGAGLFGATVSAGQGAAAGAVAGAQAGRATQPSTEF